MPARARQVGLGLVRPPLADGRDLMLYLLRRAGGSLDFARGTLVDAATARPRWLAAGDFSVRATAAGAARDRRRLPVAAGTVAVPVGRPRAPARARDSPTRRTAPRSSPALLLGGRGARAATPTASRPGSGFVELTGYGEGNRPPI